MNLHAIVGPIVGAVNPNVPVTIRSSTGYTTASDGTQVPTYAPDVVATAQIQALSSGDLLKLDGLNINGDKRGVYLYGDIQSVLRGEKLGGDLVIFPDGSTWLVAFVFEDWEHGVLGNTGWCKACLVLQVDTRATP